MAFKVKTVEKVRFFDLDAVGHLNNSVFLTYMEQARVAYFKKTNLFDERFQNEQGLGLIVARAEVDFLRPAFMDEEVEISISVTEIKNKSFVMEYELFSLTHKLQIGKGKTVIVSYDYKAKKTIPVPEALKQAIQKIES